MGISTAESGGRDTEPGGATEWCAGIPLVNRRALDLEERARIPLLRRRLLWRGAAAILLFPLLVCIFGFAAALAGRGEAAQAALAVGAILLIAVCLPVEVLVARDSFRRAAGLGRDLRLGCVERYEGAVPDETLPDPALVAMRKARLVPAPGADWWFEVLSGSGRVWRTSVGPVRRWIAAQPVGTAATPPGAAIAARWLEPVARSDGATVLAGARELSGAERDEIRRVGRRLWRRPLPYAIGLTLWLAIPLAMLLLGHHFTDDLERARFVFLAVMTIAVDLRFFSSLRSARLLERDAGAGRVTILRREDDAAESAAACESEPVTVEVLPASRWIWTTEGQPAAWRRISG